MACAIKQTESAPASYPATPSGVSSAVTDLATTIWQRIEAYVAYRWTSRAVVWVVEGPGEWHPPLSPATISTVEVWSCGANDWEDCTPPASPLGGYWLPASGPFRFTGTVGAGATVPDNVKEAFKRLGAYMVAKPGTPGARSERISAGSIDIQRSRSESWMASALQNSGAADLLRTYRKV
ncbi:hypothetical protein [Bradyrhizobium sp. LA6.7]|uniref:hypothetical protein n=1 Tax=unclassified Bradyrhizobium TaxID=2631580 RepID=UPI003397CAAD